MGWTGYPPVPGATGTAEKVRGMRGLNLNLLYEPSAHPNPSPIGWERRANSGRIRIVPWRPQKKRQVHDRIWIKMKARREELWLAGLVQFPQEVMDEGHIVALQIGHAAAHPGVALAEAQIVGRIVLGRFALGPVPLAAVLQIHHIDGVAPDNRASGLQAQIVDAAQALFKDLGTHDGRADGKHHAIIQPPRRRPGAEINCGGPSDG